ncbi:MAG: universal stress protein [Pirellulaceae bacterium]|nr:universal stress protein [Pirellulaceae bacterium]
MNQKSVVCAVDFSDVTEDVLQFAAEEALMREARLEIVHTWEPNTAVMEPMSYSMVEASDDSEVRERLTQLSVPEGVADFHKHLLCGIPADTIRDLTTKLNCALLVVGSHSQSTFSRWQLGSVAESLLRHSPCPVVVVRPKKLPGDGSDEPSA